ncbi:MAG: alpha/beta fold hydrolase [Pseudomonadota bacterium]
MKASLRYSFGLLATAAVALAVIYQFAPDTLIEARYAAERLRAGASAHRIKVGDHEWSYLEAGAGAPVVIVHGFAGSKEYWLPLLPHLPRDRRYLVVDLPGWAESTRIDGADYGIPAQAGRLADFIAAMGLDKPVVVGNSMGGHVAGVLGTRHPDKVSSLVLVAPTGVRFHANLFAQRVLAGQTPFNVDDRAGWARLSADLFELPPWLPPRVVDGLVARNQANHSFHDRVIGVLRRGENAFLLEQEFPLLRVPLSVVWCEKDRVLDVSGAEAFRYVPGARITLLPDCGHMPMMEVPAELAAAMAL